jgi:hypothetical protein
VLDYLYLNTTLLHESGSRSVVDASGLVGIASIRGDLYDLPDQDGAAEPPSQRLGGKTMVIQGEVWGPTINAAWTEWDAVAAAFYQVKDTPGVVLWQRAGGGLAFQRYVRLAGAVEPPISDGQNRLEYSVALRSADPAAYAQLVKSQVIDPTVGVVGGMSMPVFPVDANGLTIPLDLGGTGSSSGVTLLNDGNYTAKPIYTLTGPWSGAWVKNASTGQTIFTSGLTLAAGELLMIDTGGRRVTYQGADATGFIDWRQSEWPTLLPGANVIVIGGLPSAGSRFASSFQSAYIS